MRRTEHGAFIGRRGLARGHFALLALDLAGQLIELGRACRQFGCAAFALRRDLVDLAARGCDARVEVVGLAALERDLAVGELHAIVELVDALLDADEAALFDRELGAFVYANAGDISAKWRSLYAIVAAERLGPGAIEYADLRFADRIVVKPRKPITTAAAPVRSMAPSAITN